ncbi:GntR family transcriptional regulator [Microbacterium sp. YY-01]|uniref:GntR family transcriptional regulator n=1 Tax=Microbacterium sp. YY-01 TaxID=3421634 RepID=UPI003D17037D
MARSPNRPAYTEMLAPLSAARPKGIQVYERLTALISDMSAGSLLPSERVLAEQFGVSRVTVRNQVDQLVREGLVTRVLGSGTYTSQPRLPIASVLPSFSREILALGMSPGARIISAKRKGANSIVADSLGVGLDASVLEVVRVRTADGAPISLEHTYFSLERYPGLETAPLEEVSVREYLQEKYGSGGVRADRRFTIVTVDTEEAKTLEIEPGAPVFKAEVTVFDADDEVVEVGAALLRADRYEIRMQVGTTRGRRVP